MKQAQTKTLPLNSALAILLFVGLTCFLVMASCSALLSWAEGEFEIARIDCGSNREIVITAARSWEISQPIYYYVVVNGKTVVPTTYIDNNDPDNDPSTLRFSHYSTNDGNIVGVTYADHPSHYLVVHDFSSGTSYRSQSRAQLAELESKLNRARSAK